MDVVAVARGPHLRLPLPHGAPFSSGQAGRQGNQGSSSQKGGAAEKSCLARHSIACQRNPEEKGESTQLEVPTTALMLSASVLEDRSREKYRCQPVHIFALR